jgi:protein-disulfide isomerase
MSSRARTRERRQEREKQRARNRQLFAVGAVVAVAVILAVFLVLSNLPTEAAISQETIDRYAGIPQSVDEEGFPVLGDPDAPVKVVEYSSFDCPHCGEFYQSVTPALVERARNGEISFTYVPLYGTGGIRNGEGAARAAICAGKQNAFWTYHGALFDWQTAYVNQAFDGNRLETGAANLGLDVGAWNSCLRSEETNQLLVAANAAANRLEGFTGTPTVTVDGQIVTPDLNSVNQAIEAALSILSQLPSSPASEATNEATSEATEAAD